MTKKKADFEMEDYDPEPATCEVGTIFSSATCDGMVTKRVRVGDDYYLLCSECSDELYQLTLELGLDA